jgi:hypothetical protein
VSERIAYNDDAALNSVLVGRRIVGTETLDADSEFSKVIQFTLDDGTILSAHATDGGCACNNGCWSVDNPATPTGIIMNVETTEVSDGYESAIMRLYVFTDIESASELIVSSGADNGYYGWGYFLTVERYGA